MPRERAMQCLLRIMSFIILLVSLSSAILSASLLSGFIFGVGGGLVAKIIWDASE